MFKVTDSLKCTTKPCSTKAITLLTKEQSQTSDTYIQKSEKKRCNVCCHFSSFSSICSADARLRKKHFFPYDTYWKLPPVSELCVIGSMLCTRLILYKLRSDSLILNEDDDDDDDDDVYGVGQTAQLTLDRLAVELNWVNGTCDIRTISDTSSAVSCSS